MSLTAKCQPEAGSDALHRSESKPEQLDGAFGNDVRPCSNHGVASSSEVTASPARGCPTTQIVLARDAEFWSLQYVVAVRHAFVAARCASLRPELRSYDEERADLVRLLARYGWRIS